jgi:DNA-directed RNA polymerase subunit RPC12/RpoP
MCKICGTRFSPDENRFARVLSLKCPYCSHTLTRKCFSSLRMTVF